MLAAAPLFPPLLLLLLAQLLLLLLPGGVLAADEGESAALRQLFADLACDGNRTSSDVCTWPGVQCAEPGGHVVQVSLGDRGSSPMCDGGLVGSLGNLTRLEELEVRVRGQAVIRQPVVEAMLPPSLRKLTISESDLTYLPEGYLSQSNLTYLSLDGNRLRNLPNDIPASVQIVIASKNRLVTLPDNFVSWNVATLLLGENAMVAFPSDTDAPCRLPPSLRWLDLSSNLIVRLGDCFDQTPDLHDFDIGLNSIATLPPTFSTLKALQQFSAAGNMFVDVSHVVSLPNITQLILSDNLITTFGDHLSPSIVSLLADSNPLNGPLGESICQAVGMTTLFLQRCGLTDLPNCMGEMRNVAVLALNENSLATIDVLPPNVGSLSLSSNALRSLPDLPRPIYVLDLDFNQLKQLPRLVCGHPRVSLSARNNSLSSIRGLEACNFTSLFLSKNQFESFPDGIGVAAALDLSSNRISNFPCVRPIGEQLVMAIGNNNIASLPPCLTDMDGLTSLNAQSNRITTIPPLPESLSHLDVSVNAIASCESHVLSNLTYLDLSNNVLQSLPDLASIRQLATFRVSGNRQLSVPLPALLPGTLRNFYGARCNFSGSVPVQFGELEVIELTGNNFVTDTLGTYLCLAAGLKTLLLGGTNTDIHDIATCLMERSSAPLASLSVVDFSNNGLRGVDIKWLQPVLLQSSLKSLDLSKNPIGSVMSLQNIGNDIRLDYFSLRATNLSWEYVSSEYTNGIYDGGCPLITYTTGTLDLSENEIALMGSEHVALHAQTIIAGPAEQSPATNWGPGVVAGTSPFSTSPRGSLLGSSSIVRNRGNVYVGDLPSPDDVPFLKEIDIYSELSSASDVEGGWEIVPSSKTTDFVTFACPEYVTPVSPNVVGYKATVHPRFYGFRFCRCAAGFHGLAPKCHACDFAGATCDGNGTLTAEGRWPVMRGARVVDLVECPGAPSCKSVSYTVDDKNSFDVRISCADGYRDGSFLCAECDDGFFRYGTSCFQCIEDLIWLPIVYYLLKVGGTAALIVLGLIKMGGTARILLVHLSLFSILTETSTAVPSIFAVFGIASSSAQGAIMPGMECLSSKYGFVHSFLLAAVLPVLLLLLGGALFLLGVLFRSSLLRKRAFVVVTFLWLTYVLSFVQVVFTVFNCTTYGLDASGGAPGHLTNALSIECVKGPMAWMPIVAGAYGVPIVLATVLLQGWATHHMSRQQTREQSFDETIGAAVDNQVALLPSPSSTSAESQERAQSFFSFLGQPYRPEFFWWELTVTCRRLTLALITALAPYHDVLKPILIFLTLFIFLLIHLHHSPYNARLANRMETVSLSTLLLGFFALVLLEYDQAGTDLSVTGKAIAVSVVVINTAVLLLFGLVVVREKGSQLHRRIRSHLKQHETDAET